MKQKINLRLIGMSVVVVIVTVLCLTFVFYGLFQRQVRNDLRIDAELLQAAGMFESGSGEADPESEITALASSNLGDIQSLRMTWIAADGTVLYDNDTDAASLENHFERPEFQDALASGEGEATRRSDTMDTNTYYYAILLDDGSVLRLAADARSIFSIFTSVIPILILIVAIIIVVAVIVGRLLTRQLLKPIETMAQNIEDTAHTPVYKELVPFVNTIREQHDNILSAAKARQDFTANVSHELKTPLTAISGYAELIENHMVDQDQEEKFAEQIRLSADRLVTLINDIIRLSELDAGAEDDSMTFEQMDLYTAASNRIELLKVSAEKKNIRLTLEGESCPMRGNPTMITELIDNLCQNAIRYNSENGQVRVVVQMEEERPALTVEDTGIGIPKDMQDRVFERFFRVDKSHSKETGGTGLGLAIVKHIVELHDAEITLTSDVGKGTVIKVRF
ncbi:MAG: two-component sensor histidine kinase [Lachnospiraceae bacterium]|nr:two-component sensor histidine kinase [Lachnospiraceae bacterium]